VHDDAAAYWMVCMMVLMLQVASKFPVVNSLLNAIRRKKSKDTLVIAGVIAACIVFTFLYLLSK
jgi:golgi SNAP receptor complex member 1